MRLFPRLAMLFACVPLLLPPGLCACGASETRANAEVAPKEAHPPKCCGCNGRTKRVAPAAQRFSPAPHEPGHPLGHAPGCPATANGSKWTDRAGPLVQLTAVAFDTVPAYRSALTLAVSSPFAGARSAAPPHFPSLYLTHCALLF